jgi:hypothetical protein
VDDLGFDSWKGQEVFFILKIVQTGSGANPAPCSMGTMVPSLSIKRLVHEVYHSPPYSAKVKNELNYTSSPLYALMVWAGTTVPSASSREKCSFEGRALTKWLNSASCMDSQKDCECWVGFDLNTENELVVKLKS